MSPPETGPLARRDGGPGFDHAWQAEVLALADTLADAGLFSRSDWSRALGAALRRAAGAGVSDTQESYYQAALAALEELLASRGVVTARALDTRQADWVRAYRDTPHGAPVRLRPHGGAPPGKV